MNNVYAKSPLRGAHDGYKRRYRGIPRIAHGIPVILMVCKNLWKNDLSELSGSAVVNTLSITATALLIAELAGIKSSQVSNKHHRSVFGIESSGASGDLWIRRKYTLSLVALLPSEWVWMNSLLLFEPNRHHSGWWSDCDDDSLIEADQLTTQHGHFMGRTPRRCSPMSGLGLGQFGESGRHSIN